MDIQIISLQNRIKRLESNISVSQIELGELYKMKIELSDKKLKKVLKIRNLIK